METPVAVRGTILAATALWAAAEWIRLRHPRRWRAARLSWTVGAILSAVHLLAAMHLVHGWSHDAALRATALQTAALTGLDWGGGLYINYLFIAFWLIDAGWWWVVPDRFLSRTRIHAGVIRAVFIFMFVNGAVIFARGAGRIVGILAIGTVCWAWFKPDRANRSDSD
jgi:hypothetical protein